MIQSIVTIYRAAFSGLPREIWLLALMTLVNRSGMMVLPFITLYLTREQGMSVARAGSVLAVWGVGSIAGSWLGGWLADRVGTGRAMHVSLIGGGAGFLVLGQVRGYTAIVVTVLAVSVIYEAFRPAVLAAFAERASDGLRMRAFALLRLSLNLGLSVGPAVGGFLAELDYGWLFVGDALTCLAASVVLALTLRSTPPDHAARAASQRRSPWRDVPFLMLMMIVILLAAAIFQILGALPIYFRNAQGFSESTIGLLLAINPVIAALFEMVIVHWAERRNLMRLIGVGCFLTCAGFGLMPLGVGIAYMAFTVVVWTVGEMLTLPLITAVVGERAGAGNQGRYMGLYTAAFSLSFVVAPALGTWVYERFGPDTLWYGVGAMGLALWLFVALVSRPVAAHDSRSEK